jgi:archaellum component FlaC
MGETMTIDERLERLTERHEALAQSLELLSHEVRETRVNVESLVTAVRIDAENIRALARIAEIHEHRLTDLEN